MSIIYSFFIPFREKWQDRAPPQGQIQAGPLYQEASQDPDRRDLRVISRLEEEGWEFWPTGLARWQAGPDPGGETLPPGRTGRQTNHGADAESQGCQNEYQMKVDLCI